MRLVEIMQLSAVEKSNELRKLETKFRHFVQVASNSFGASCTALLYTPAGIGHCGYIDFTMEHNEDQDFLHTLLTKLINSFDVPFMVNPDVEAVGVMDGSVAFDFIPKNDKIEFLETILARRSINTSVKQ